MGATEEIIKMAKENNGTVTTAMVVAAGISRGNIKYLVDKGMIEKSARGVYILPEVWDDEIFNLQSRFKRGIYSHETALFFHDLTDREPSPYSITVKTGYNPSSLRSDGIRVYTVKNELHSIGVTTAMTTFGNQVLVYDMERMICDLIRSRSNIEIQSFQGALKQYAGRKDKNLRVLMRYAGMFRVEKILRQYMEVLL